MVRAICIAVTLGLAEFKLSVLSEILLAGHWGWRPLQGPSKSLGAWMINDLVERDVGPGDSNMGHWGSLKERAFMSECTRRAISSTKRARASTFALQYRMGVPLQRCARNICEKFFVHTEET